MRNHFISKTGSSRSPQSRKFYPVGHQSRLFKVPWWSRVCLMTIVYACDQSDGLIMFYSTYSCHFRASFLFIIKEFWTCVAATPSQWSSSIFQSEKRQKICKKNSFQLVMSHWWKLQKVKLDRHAAIPSFQFWDQFILHWSRLLFPG